MYKFKDVAWLCLPIVLWFVFIGSMMYVLHDQERNRVVYNCNMLIGGWHPDFPKEVIDACRKIKSGRI